MVISSLASGETVSQAGRIPAWTPCSADPVFFDCQDCEIGLSPCRLRQDDSLRHWRAAQYSRHSGPLSAKEERDNEIEGEIIRLLRSHGVSVNVSLLLEYVPRETLSDITGTELENLVRKSPKFVESSPRMFKLKDKLQEDCGGASFRPLPVSSGSQLYALIENSPTLGTSRQTRLFKEYGGLNLLASFETRQTARTALDETVNDYLEAVLSKRGWTVRTMYTYAVGPETASNGDVLTEEEISLTSRLLSAVSAGELLTRMSPVEASRRASDVREILLLGNLRLVAHEARIRAYGGFLAFADLFQIGTIGLMTAMERFDPFRGFQFSTYATYWIRQVIRREQANLDRSIRLPVHVVEELNSLEQRRVQLESELQRNLTSVELADELSRDPDRVEFLLKLADPPASLDLLLEDGHGAVENELLLHETPDSEQQRNLSNRITRDAVEKALLSLSAREAQVIKFRFGIGVGSPQTLEQVGQHFGVTRERIRQIEAKALKKLRGPKTAYQLRDLLHV